jgi:hypothetical protein
LKVGLLSGLVTMLKNIYSSLFKLFFNKKS